MVRDSLRQLVIRRLSLLVHCTAYLYIRYYWLGMSTDDVEDWLCYFHDVREQLLSRRYLFPRKQKKRTPKFHTFLDPDHHDGVTDNEFRFHFRLSRVHFWDLHELIKDHEAFRRRSSDSRGPMPKKAAYQLLVLLKYLGTDGNQACSKALGRFFGVGSGAIDRCRKNALVALLSLEPMVQIAKPALLRLMCKKDDHRFDLLCRSLHGQAALQRLLVAFPLEPIGLHRCALNHEKQSRRAAPLHAPLA